MNWSEIALTFDCHGETLVGVLSRPERPHGTGVLIVVGGPQYRAGSHRQFVWLARALAAAGYPTLRFDYRGMGDSSGVRRNFDSIDEDIAIALSTFGAAQPGIDRYVLWGLCDGASAALLYVGATHDPRVVGLCLANPWVRSETSLARTHMRHYYAARLAQRAFWFKLASGNVGSTALRDLVSNVRRLWRGDSGRASTGAPGAATLRYQQRMALSWQRFGGHILLLLSGNDLTAREFIDFAGSNPEWRDALTLPKVQMRKLPAADHTFSNAGDRVQAETLTVAWLAALDAPVPTSVPTAGA